MGVWKFLVTKKFFSAKKHLPGVLKCKQTKFGGGGRSFFSPLNFFHAGSENDTLLPMTRTCDRLKFWSGLAWRSKIIIRKPWWRKNKKNKILKNSDKTIRHSRREAGNA